MEFVIKARLLALISIKLKDARYIEYRNDLLLIRNKLNNTDSFKAIINILINYRAFIRKIQN